MKLTRRGALAGALSLAAIGEARAGTVLDGIAQRGTLRVGMTGDYKPFTFRDPDGTWRGADVEMAKRLAAALGVQAVFVPTTWGTMMADFQAGKFDIAMGGVTILKPRAEKGPFTQAVFVDGKRPIARCADKDRFTSIAAIDRPEVRVIVNPGAANEQFARASFPHAQLIVHPDNATVFAEIAAGRADVMVTDGIEVDHQAHLLPALCAAAVPAPFTRLEKAYWMQPDPDFAAKVNAWLADEMASGAWRRTLEQALAMS